MTPHNPTRRPLMALALGMLLGACGGTRQTPVEHIKLNPETREFELGVSVVDSFRNANEPFEELYSPNVAQLEGEHVVVRGGGKLVLNLCAPDVDPETVTEKEYYERGIIVPPATVNVQYNVDPVWGTIMPSDHDSLAMVTGYVIMDDVWNFYRDVIGDRSRATEHRATMAFYAEGAAGCDNDPYDALPPLLPPAPFLVADNAAYVRNADLFIILRDAVLASGVEIGINPGVLAHEFAHRVFQQNVYGQSREGFELLVITSVGSDEAKARLCTDPTPLDGFDECAFTSFVINGLDEGIADVYAYAYTGEADFLFSRSLNAMWLEEPLLRDLSRAPDLDTDLPFYGREFLLKTRLQTEENPAPIPFNFYRLGTLWARGFYAGIVDPQTGRQPQTEAERAALARSRYAPAVLRAQRLLGQDLVEEYRLEPQQFLRRYIQEVVREPDGSINNNVRAGVCAALCDRFGYDPLVAPINGASPQCNGFAGSNAAAPTPSFPCQL